jgi:FHS family L-fucose permease-like MFS transporter
MKKLSSKGYSLIILINLMFLQAGLLVSIMSALIPNIIESYKLSYSIASTLPFAFYIAFGIFCIPAGVANEKFTPRKVLIFAFMLSLAGSLVFAIYPNYYASVGSLFIIGSSIAIIMVSILPVLRVACGPENLAFHSSLNQLLYGAGAFLSPHIYSFLTSWMLNKQGNHGFLFNLLSRVVPPHFEWITVYWFFSVFIVITIGLIALTKFPEIKDEETRELADRKTYLDLLKNKYIILYLIVLAAYASCEQGNAVWMSKFFQDYHNLSPLTTGANILSWYWILLSCGCLAGMMLLKIFESRKVLAVFTVFAIISFSFGIYGPAGISKIAFPLVGIFESVMWPIIMSLALNSVSKHHGTLTGLLYFASIGGALGPFIIGYFGDFWGLRLSYNYIYIPMILILSVYFWAKPLVSNKTI